MAAKLVKSREDHSELGGKSVKGLKKLKMKVTKITLKQRVVKKPGIVIKITLNKE